jgi:lysozyme family protein
MAQFEPAIANTLSWEDPSGRGVATRDSGGFTRYGISAKAYPDLDIELLTREDAIAIYRKDYWDTRWEGLASQNIANKLMDCVVNMGKKPGVKILQKALNTMGEKTVVDGVFGGQTLAAANRCDSQTLLTDMRAECCEFYRTLCEANPEKYAKYLQGWLRRARS